MNPLFCILLITSAGMVGGITNAFLSGNGFALPAWRSGVWCPGALSNVFIGAVSALSSWALYGAGASIDLARLSDRQQIGMQLSAVVGALLVGMSGARWLTNEADKRLLKETVKVAGAKRLSVDECRNISDGTPREMLEAALRA
jgi:hypothetical protein